LAVQATSPQITEFQVLLKDAESAKANLQTFIQQQSHAGAGSEFSVDAAAITRSLQQLGADSQKFVEGFSAAQKSGLKETLKKLGEADSNLDADEKKLDESVPAGSRATTELESRVESLAKSLADFSNQEFTLGRELGIVLAEGSDQTFKLAEVRMPVSIGKQTITVTVSALLWQVAAQGAERTFKLLRIVDLSDLQQKLTELVRAQLDTAGACGERLAVREATIAASSPASVLALELHYERWSCMRLAGQSTAQELAEADGSVEVKLTPVVEKENFLRLVTELSRINAAGVMGESLRSGNLGEELRDKLSRAILSALQTGINFQNNLPSEVRHVAMVQNAKFQGIGVGKLGVVLDGQLVLSDEQVHHLANELNQAQFAQGTAVTEASSPKSKSTSDH
jgi:hypothetical protein